MNNFKFRKVTVHYLVAFLVLICLLVLLNRIIDSAQTISFISASAFAFGIFQVLLNRAFQNHRDYDQIKLSLYNKMDDHLREFKATVNESLEYEKIDWRGSVQKLININNDIRSLIKFNEESFFPSLRTKQSTEKLMSITQTLMSELDKASILALEKDQKDLIKKLIFKAWSDAAHKHMPDFFNVQYEFLKDFQKLL